MYTFVRSFNKTMSCPSPSILAFGKAASTFLKDYYKDECQNNATNLHAMSLEAIELPIDIFQHGNHTLYNTMSHSTPICVEFDQTIVNTFGIIALSLVPRHYFDDFEIYMEQIVCGIRSALAHLNLSNILTDDEIMQIFRDPVDMTTGQVSALVIDATVCIDDAWQQMQMQQQMHDVVAY